MVGLGLAVVLTCTLVPVSAFLLFHTLGEDTTTWKTWGSGDWSSELEPRTVLASGHPLPFSELHAKYCNTDETSSHSFFILLKTVLASRMPALVPHLPATVWVRAEAKVQEYQA